MELIIQIVKQLKVRLANIITVADVVRNAEGKLQVKAINDEILDNTPHMQQYAFRSSPKAGSKGLKLNRLSDGSKPVLIIVDDLRYHFTALKDGEAIIEVSNGDKIHMKQGNVIDVVTGQLNIKAANVNIEGDLNVNGNIKDSSNTSLADLRNTYNSHTNPNGGVVVEKVEVETE